MEPRIWWRKPLLIPPPTQAQSSLSLPSSALSPHPQNSHHNAHCNVAPSNAGPALALLTFRVLYPGPVGSRLEPPWGKGTFFPLPRGRCQPPLWATWICACYTVGIGPSTLHGLNWGCAGWGRVFGCGLMARCVGHTSCKGDRALWKASNSSSPSFEINH